ncbi:orotidine-5'-phosphate decarboxylase [Cenarchaeum symbiosum A]|uniref:Orotidine 5'-phosphate decarboxylase n=1 Tax=Cenarchaeum symbiosum (strain A) TaxID=414004 RepID=A0RXM3_CENSY|nr:orotidine-5'-phosphate decarboxylase [Cenarchaeum symbiosum A]
MSGFRERIRRAAAKGGPIVLAADYDSGSGAVSRATRHVEALHPHICAIKLNLHLLLPLGRSEISEITRAARRRGLLAIADIKLNDIGNTNRAAAGALWGAGFDAVIANPIMGKEELKELISGAHRRGKGVIALCHMSSPGAAASYEMGAGGGKKFYEVFMDWALEAGADGVVAGATFPETIRYCSRRAGGKLDVYSPGIGAQGGSMREAISAGAAYPIVGRTIIGARNPAAAAQRLAEDTQS